MKTIIIKDWLELRSSKQALLPMIILPIIFVIVLPIIFLASGSNTGNSAQMTQMLQKMPQNIFPHVFTIKQKIYYLEYVYMMSSLFLIIPVMIASIISANSFAGEKERRTIEGLLYTPVSDNELILGKILSTFIPATVITIVCFVMYSIIVDILTFPIFHFAIMPNLIWILLIFWLSPLLSFAAFILIVAISERAKSVWAAQQMSAFLVLPIVAMMGSQVTGVMMINPLIVTVIGIVLLFIDIAAYYWLSSHVNREQLVTNFT